MFFRCTRELGLAGMEQGRQSQRQRKQKEAS
jgi:hypothetical protein